LSTIAGAQTKLADRFRAACGRAPLDFDALMRANGLGYESLAERCAAEGGGVPADTAALAACVAREHACAAERLFDFAMPRAKELMRVAGVEQARVDALTCLGNRAGAGAHLPATARKPLLACGRAAVRGFAKIADAELRQRAACAGAAFACVQLKPGETACLTKAKVACAARRTAAGATRSTVIAALMRACGDPPLPFATVAGESGLGLAAMAGACGAHGVGTLASIGDYATCVARQHACTAADATESEAPRAGDLLALVGDGPPAPACPLLP
jgi:hypothetical protein